MSGGPLLDQVSSHALARLAAERGVTPVVFPAGEEAVRKRGRKWTRWAPYLFLGLSLFALASMSLGIYGVLDGSWRWSDLVQLALMTLLVLGVVQQSHAIIRTTRLGRRIGGKPATGLARSRPPLPLLDAAPHDEILATPAILLAEARGATLGRATGQFSGRVAIAGVVALAALAFAGMVFVCGYIAWSAGPWDPALWLTAPFAALTGLGSYSVFRSARQAAFRGRPFALISRAFRDSVRVWGSGTIATKAALATTATASVAGAAIAPAVFQADTPYDLFVVDASSGVFYRVDLETGTSTRLGTGAPDTKVTGLGATSRPLPLPGGGRLPGGSILAAVESAGGQGLVALAGESRGPVPLVRVDPALPGAFFTASSDHLYAVTPDGGLWRIDPASGAASEVGPVEAPVGPLGYDTGRKLLLMASGSNLVQIDPATGAVERTTPLSVPEGFRACGLARGPGDRLFLADESTGAILLARGDGLARTVLLAGDLPARPCAMTLARRD